MNAKVTTYWMFGKPITQEMPEAEVERYLQTAKSSGTMKGYIVDAVPLEEIQPRAPIPADAVTTIFPVTSSNGKVHAAYVLDYKTDKFSTMCGKAIRDSAAVEHRVTEVTCNACRNAVG
jgi:hypothetical protein